MPVVPLPEMTSQALDEVPQMVPMAVPISSASESEYVEMQVSWLAMQSHRPLLGVGGRAVATGQLELLVGQAPGREMEGVYDADASEEPDTEV